MDGRVIAGGIGAISGHTDTGRTQEVKHSEPNNDAEKRTTWPLTQNHLCYICVEWMVKGDNDARLPCSWLNVAFQCHFLGHFSTEFKEMCCASLLK